MTTIASIKEQASTLRNTGRQMEANGTALISMSHYGSETSDRGQEMVRDGRALVTQAADLERAHGLR